MKEYVTLAAAAAITLTAAPAFAQASTQQQTTQQDRLGAILGALFGDRSGTATSIDAQWAIGQTPLTNQQLQFRTRVDSEVARALEPGDGALKYDRRSGRARDPLRRRPALHHG